MNVHNAEELRKTINYLEDVVVVVEQVTMQNNKALIELQAKFDKLEASIHSIGQELRSITFNKEKVKDSNYTETKPNGS